MQLIDHRHGRIDRVLSHRQKDKEGEMMLLLLLYYEDKLLVLVSALSYISYVSIGYHIMTSAVKTNQ